LPTEGPLEMHVRIDLVCLPFRWDSEKANTDVAALFAVGNVGWNWLTDSTSTCTVDQENIRTQRFTNVFIRLVSVLRYSR
jgi:hypothetical protein